MMTTTATMKIIDDEDRDEVDHDENYGKYQYLGEQVFGL